MYVASRKPLFKGVLSKYHMSSVIATPHRTSGQTMAFTNATPQSVSLQIK